MDQQVNQSGHLSHGYRQLDRQSLWHPYTRFSEILNEPFPVIVRGDGVYLFDAEGRRYFDAIASWWCCNLGHSHPRLVAAIRQQVKVLQHSILGNMSHPCAIELAGRLRNLLLAAGGEYRAFFASDGASAVEAALKIAVQYWYNRGRSGKIRFCALKEAYHGDTLAAVSLGYLETFHRPFRDVVFDVFRIDPPRCTCCAYGGTLQECSLDCIQPLESLLERHAGNLAAVILEPIFQGAAGMWVYRAEYLRRVSELCRVHDVLLIVDEIASGFGRTGKMFAFEHAGVVPDIICLGKGLTAGTLPMSATMVREEIFATFSDKPRDCTFYHGHTFCGNPVAAAAACAALDVYQKDDIPGMAARTGRQLQQEGERFRKHPLVEDVRGIGMMWAIQLRSFGGRRGDVLARQLRRLAWERGLLIRPLGPVVYLMPPLITPYTVLAKALNEIEEILDLLVPVS